ncbi:uncharacterized protein [Trachinotus anak]|uniref:uncharacterized protein n=1 Tax=Trachinotus anak TaxID=443729 RepID=UPI0039F20FFD
MVELKWIKMSLFVMLGLQFTAVTGEDSFLIVRDGEEATLPCNSVRDDQDKCDRTTWIFSPSSRETVELIVLGQIGERAQSKSDRLSVTENCSLVLKKVTRDDAGLYSCRQFKSGKQQGPDALVLLSVVTMTEEKNGDIVFFYCSVSTYEQCRYTVQWLYEDGKGDSTSVETTSTTCSARVSFNTSHLHHKSKYKESVKCEVTDTHSRTLQLFNFTPQSSPEKTAEPNGNRPTPEQVPGWWWLFVGAAVGLAALLMIAVVVIRWKKTKGNKTQLDDNTRLSLNPAATQPGAEAGPDVTDPEDGVSYASISYTQRTNGKDKVQVKDDDDAVTYSAVKTPSSSAGASTDPSSIYASVNKPNKSEATV